ncbi:MAG: TraY domain-containing protein [bacterium]|nr:TraY domain-containing protein [bacterium]
MAQILVRDLDDDLVKRLKKRAKQNGRSLEAEIRIILDQSDTITMSDARKLADKIRARFKGRKQSDSAALIREDRDR